MTSPLPSHPLPLALLGLLLAGCSGDPPVQSAGPADTSAADHQLVLSAEAVTNLGLGLQTVGAGELREYLQLQGEVMLDPFRVAQVPARLSGVVDRVHGHVGEVVSPGDELAVISSRELADSIMAYVTTEWAFRHAMSVLERETALREKDINSEAQLMDAQRQYHQAEGAHSVALQHLHLLGYTEKQLHTYLERPDLQDLTVFTVRAPIAGSILSRNLERGAAVEPGQSLFRLADLSQLTVDFQVPLRHLRAVEVGMTVEVASEALDLSGTAEILRIVSQVEAASRAVPVQATLPNPGLEWKPGMPARIAIKGAPSPVDVAVPLAAVHEWEGQTMVFVHDEGSRFSLRPVRLGRRDATQAEVVSGLEPGEEIATTNSFLLLAEWENQAGGA